MKKILLLCIIALTLMATALPVQAFEAGVQAYYWFPALDGDIKYSDNSLIATTPSREPSSIWKTTWALMTNTIPLVKSFLDWAIII